MDQNMLSKLPRLHGIDEQNLDRPVIPGLVEQITSMNFNPVAPRSRHHFKLP